MDVVPQQLDELAPVMFDVAQLVPSSSVATTLLDVLHDKRNEFVNDGKKKTPASVATVTFSHQLLPSFTEFYWVTLGFT